MSANKVPSTVLEAHGTGTALGDPIEACPQPIILIAHLKILIDVGGCCRRRTVSSWFQNSEGAHGTFIRKQKEFSPMRIPQGKHGSSGGERGRGWSRVASCHAGSVRGHCSKRTVAAVPCVVDTFCADTNSIYRACAAKITSLRLNAHVLSLLVSEM